MSVILANLGLILGGLAILELERKRVVGSGLSRGVFAFFVRDGEFGRKRRLRIALVAGNLNREGRLLVSRQPVATKGLRDHEISVICVNGLTRPRRYAKDSCDHEQCSHKCDDSRSFVVRCRTHAFPFSVQSYSNIAFRIVRHFRRKFARVAPIFHREGKPGRKAGGQQGCLIFPSGR